MSTQSRIGHTGCGSGRMTKALEAAALDTANMELRKLMARWRWLSERGETDGGTGRGVSGSTSATTAARFYEIFPCS
jgi:hypothetical protein